MKMLRSQHEIQATSATPSADALGFNMTAELDKAMNLALKPVASKLRAYNAEVNRQRQTCERWSKEALAERLHEIATAAQAGDESAIAAISTGAVPNKATYEDMSNRAYLALERFCYENRGIFAEAAALIRAPMEAVVERGQKILDTHTDNFGMPRYQLTGYSNHINFVVGELEKAAANLSHTNDVFWQRLK